jgi:hypothetical protein
LELKFQVQIKWLFKISMQIFQSWNINFHIHIKIFNCCDLYAKVPIEWFLGIENFDVIILPQGCPKIYIKKLIFSMCMSFYGHNGLNSLLDARLNIFSWSSWISWWQNVLYQWINSHMFLNFFKTILWIFFSLKDSLISYLL